DLPLADLPAGRCAFVRAGETWYLLAEAPVRVDGEPVTERRVTDGTRIAVDGHNLRVHHLAAGAPIPGETDDVLLDLPENWPLGGPHAVLVHRRGKRETIIPFSGEVLALGRDPDDPVVPADGDFVYRLARTDGGYTLEDRTGSGMSELPPVLPLQHGDTFDIDDRTFTFRVKGVSETPSIPLTREERMAMVPLLVYDDPDGQQVVLPVLDDVFSVGRGGGNDLQLAGDPEISRHHCMLVRGTDGACILRDSGSANGTYVNGRLVERHILQVGDVIQIGDSTLEFRLGRREELEAELPDLVLEPVEETTSSRADTAAFRRPGR
ncbi:MAG: FHA domain-containing protein, partial [Deltaproteobacteria bacterium]